MKVIETKHYILEFDKFRTFPIEEDKHLFSNITLKYSQPRVRDYRFEVNMTRQQLMVNFGCKYFTIEQLEEAILFLEDKLIPKKGKRLCKLLASGKLSSKFIESPLKEESDSYYITENGRLYPKKDYQLKIVALKQDILTASKGYYTGIYQGSTKVCNNSSEAKTDLLEKLKYAIYVVKETDKHLKSLQNGENK